MAAESTVDDIDLGALEFWLDDPEPMLQRLRRERPVVYEPTSGCWIVLRHADVRAALRDTALFSSALGIHRPSPRASAIDDYLAGSLIVSDPPDHTFLRKLVMPGFTPRTVRALEDRVRQLTVEHLEAVEEGQTYDVVHDLAAHVPASIICELLGIPRADQEHVAALIEACGGGFDNRNPVQGEPSRLVFDYLERLLADRGTSEPDDLITTISRPADDGRRLTPYQVMQFCFLLLIGGTDNTRATISTGMERLGVLHAERDALAADPGLLSTATEEMIRYGSVAAITARTAMRDTELSGFPIPAGGMVLLVIASANHDEDVFGPDAGDFRHDRTPNPHLGWGFGAHACVGAPLARLTIRVFFDELLQRFASWETGEPSPMGNFEHYCGLDRLPVILHRR